MPTFLKKLPKPISRWSFKSSSSGGQPPHRTSTIYPGVERYQNILDLLQQLDLELNCWSDQQLCGELTRIKTKFENTTSQESRLRMQAFLEVVGVVGTFAAESEQSDRDSIGFAHGNALKDAGDLAQLRVAFECIDCETFNDIVKEVITDDDEISIRLLNVSECVERFVVRVREGADFDDEAWRLGRRILWDHVVGKGMKTFKDELEEKDDATSAMTAK